MVKNRIKDTFESKKIKTSNLSSNSSFKRNIVRASYIFVNIVVFFFILFLNYYNNYEKESNGNSICNNKNEDDGIANIDNLEQNKIHEYCNKSNFNENLLYKFIILT